MAAYRGDTLPKKIVRARVWETVHRKMRTFRNKRFLALAGHEAADVGVAVALGAEPSNIVLVDKSKKAANSAQWRYPDVQVFTGELEDVLDKQQFDFAFLDFCSQMTDSTLTLAGLTVTECLLKSQGYLAVTFLCGREQPADPVYEKIFRVQASLPEQNRAQLSRAVVVQREIQKRVRRSSITTVPIAHWFYNSDSDKSHLQMGVYLCQVLSASRIDKDKANEIANKARATTTFVSELSTTEMVDEIYRLEDAGLDPCLVLNMSKGTVAAYKAHATRGTYS
jgi:hypothetical protein